MIEFTLLMIAGFILGYQLGLTQKKNGRHNNTTR